MHRRFQIEDHHHVVAMAGDEHNQTPEPSRSEGTDQQDRLALLPDDVLADIFGRVPPRWLAAARCICRAWRDAIDSRGLLRADLLPLSLAGLFVHFRMHKFPEYLARPSSKAGARAFSGDLSFLPSATPHCALLWENDRIDRYAYNIEDHCNGLLLLTGNYVVNPATRRWHTLPTCPPKRGAGNIRYCMHLVYDPMISPYYEVVMIPTLGSHKRGDEVDPLFEESEWPPSRCKMYVFSSKSGCWEERYFGREGDAAGVGREMRGGYWSFKAIYFRGALYGRIRYNFLMRISLSNNKYCVIKTPVDRTAGYYPRLDVARSEKGVYFVAWCNYWLRVWVLNESSGQMKWMLKHDKDLKPMLARHRFDQQVYTPWILEDINYSMFLSSRSPEDNNKSATGEILEWNSDDDDGGKNKDLVKQCDSIDNQDRYGDIEILGFHPYKEVVFLSSCSRTGLAYHLNNSKTEVIGNIYPKKYDKFKELPNEGEEITCFPYTPCWIEEF